MAMTKEDMEGLKMVFDSILDRFHRLEKAVKEIELCGIKFCGVHQRALSYSRGNVTLRSSTAWVCVVDKTEAMPGDSPDWQLLIKGQ